MRTSPMPRPPATARPFYGRSSSWLPSCCPPVISGICALAALMKRQFGVGVEKMNSAGIDREGRTRPRFGPHVGWQAGVEQGSGELEMHQGVGTERLDHLHFAAQRDA